MRILQIGMGRWGRDWATTVVPQVPDAELVACVDLSTAARAETVKAGIISEGRCFASLDHALEKSAPDAVLVTTDMTSHVAMIRSALEAGKPVLSEKPLAGSLAEAQDIVEFAARCQLTLMVSQNYRFFPAIRAVQRVVADGSLGKLVHIAIDFRRFSSPSTAAGHRGWTEPLLLDMSIHHFDLLRAVTGKEATSVFCRSWNPSWAGFKEAPEGTATIQMDDGVVVSYRGTWISPARPTPWAGEWRMEFEKGEVWWTSRGDRMSADEDSAMLYRNNALQREEAIVLPGMRLIDRAGSLAHFLECLSEERTPETSARDNIGSLAITYAAIQSAQRAEQILLAR